MCGIIGCAGARAVTDRVVEGLRRLEYRGYDSAGIAWFDRAGKLKTERAAGRISVLESHLARRTDFGGATAIAHTRWATHGAPTDENSHPHGSERVQLVHNGIIENAAEISRELLALGYRFSSDTDTEAAALLLDRLSRECESNAAAMQALAERLKGSFAIAALFADEPGRIYAIRRESPLLVAIGEGECYLTSDLAAVLSRTRRYIELCEGELAILSPSGAAVLDREGRALSPRVRTAAWSAEAAERGGHPHFMHKEIFEEPRAICDTLSGAEEQLSSESPLVARLACAARISIVACGTAYHAGLLGARAIERLARIPVSVSYASEFRYRNPILLPSEPILFVSQSGETADTLAALRLARERGAYPVAVVNVLGSAIAREAEIALYTRAGPEIAVASTKAYTVQAALLSLLALRIAKRRGLLLEAESAAESAALAQRLPSAISAILRREDELSKLAADFKGVDRLFFIGRAADADAAAEASLKLKEISYIHSEAYPAGELKHGTISLIESGTPVIALSTEPHLREKLLGNMREVASRGARLFLFASGEAEQLVQAAERSFVIPSLPPLSAPIALATALQLLSYHAAVLRGCDVDRPRNLAKSVTVE